MAQRLCEGRHEGIPLARTRSDDLQPRYHNGMSLPKKWLRNEPRWASLIGGHDRTSGGQGLEKHETERLVESGQCEDIGRSHEHPDLGVWNRSCEDNPVSDAEFACEPHIAPAFAVWSSATHNEKRVTLLV